MHGGNGSKKVKRKISSSDVMISEKRVGQFSSLKEEFEVDNWNNELDILFTNTKMEDKTVEESTIATAPAPAASVIDDFKTVKAVDEMEEAVSWAGEDDKDSLLHLERNSISESTVKGKIIKKFVS